MCTQHFFIVQNRVGALGLKRNGVPWGKSGVLLVAQVNDFPHDEQRAIPQAALSSPSVAHRGLTKNPVS